MLGAKDATGKKLTSREDILTHATDFYKTSNNILQPQNYRSPADEDKEVIPPILQSEVRSTIASTKNGKCPGEDGKHNKYLKMGSDLLIPTITNLFNQILEIEEIPTTKLQTNQLAIKPIQTVHADHNEENVQDTRQEPTSRTGRL